MIRPIRSRELPDGLTVALCGAGSPLPDPKRSGPCVAVIAGKHLYEVDAGDGAGRVMTRLGYRARTYRRAVPDALSFRSHRRARRGDGAALGGRRACAAAADHRTHRRRTGGRRLQCRVQTRFRISARAPRPDGGSARRRRRRRASVRGAGGGCGRGRVVGGRFDRHRVFGASRSGVARGRLQVRIRRALGRDFGRHREVGEPRTLRAERRSAGARRVVARAGRNSRQPPRRPPGARTSRRS